MYFIAFRPRELQERGLSREKEREVLREVSARLGWRAHVLFLGAVVGGCGALFALSAFGGAMPLALRIAAGACVGGLIMLAGRAVGRLYVATTRGVLEERDAREADARG